jgi:hypothetical protein
MQRPGDLDVPCVASSGDSSCLCFRAPEGTATYSEVDGSGNAWTLSATCTVSEPCASSAVTAYTSVVMVLLVPTMSLHRDCSTAGGRRGQRPSVRAKKTPLGLVTDYLGNLSDSRDQNPQVYYRKLNQRKRRKSLTRRIPRVGHKYTDVVGRDPIMYQQLLVTLSVISPLLRSVIPLRRDKE